MRYSLSSLGLLEEVGHLDFVFSQRSKKQKEAKDRRVGVDPVVGELVIIFRSLFALAARSGDRKGSRSWI